MSRASCSVTMRLGIAARGSTPPGSPGSAKAFSNQMHYISQCSLPVVYFEL